MRNKIHEANDSQVSDNTPLPFLSLMVRAGILRDLAESVIAYGLKPMLSRDNKVLDATIQFQDFVKGVMDAIELPQQNVIQTWRDLERCIACVSASGTGRGTKNIRYDVIKSQEANIKHDRNFKETPSLINLMIICWQAMICTEYFNPNSGIFDPMLLEEEYIGNSQRTQLSRYYSIKFKKPKWDPSFFNRKAPSTEILSFMQFVMFLCGINTRPGLMSKKRNSIHRRACDLKTNLIEKIHWKLEIDFSPNEEGILQCEETIKDTSSTKKRRETINSLSTVKDAVDLCIKHEGFASELPNDFMPYWKMMCDHIESLKNDDNKKKGYRNENPKRKRSDGDDFDATNVKKKTNETITFPNGNVLQSNDPISADIVTLLNKKKP